MFYCITLISQLINQLYAVIIIIIITIIVILQAFWLRSRANACDLSEHRRSSGACGRGNSSSRSSPRTSGSGLLLPLLLPSPPLLRLLLLLLLIIIIIESSGMFILRELHEPRYLSAQFGRDLRFSSEQFLRGFAFSANLRNTFDQFTEENCNLRNSSQNFHKLFILHYLM